MSTSKFTACSTCNTERETATLTKQGQCPFCVDAGVPPPPPAGPKIKLNKGQRAYPEVVIKDRAPSAPKAAPAPDQPAPQTPRASSASRQQAVDEAWELPYAAPAFDTAQAEADPMKELASRALCRRRFLPFVQRYRPKYMAGWVHVDICRRLERFVRDVEQGKEPRMLLMMPPRSGKLLADDTLVPTPRGYRCHGDLQPGDEVFHPTGRVVTVVGVSAPGVADVRVTFSDGASYLCHENHEWTLFDRKRSEWKTLEAGHFLRPSHLGSPPKTLDGARSVYQLPPVAALEYQGEDYTAHPYVLGAWLGDGSAGKACITGTKRDGAIIDKIAALGYPVSAVCEHRTTGVLTTYFSGPRPNVSGRMTKELQGLGIYTQKRIPPEYQRLRTSLRLELLAGLVDTDGTTDKQSRVSITTVSRELAADIVQLCAGLGFRPYMQEVQPMLSTSGIQGKKVCYVIGFQPTMSIPVALPRKRIMRFAAQRRIGLVGVARVPAAESQKGRCIQVDSPDGLYVVGEQITATHNSELGSRHFPPWVLGQHPDWEIIAASHTSSLTLSFSRYIRDLLRDPSYQALFPDLRLDPTSQSVENWNTLSGGGYMAAGVGTGITGRGAHILLLDDLVKDIEAADSPTIRENTWEWYGSTAYTRLAPGGGVLGIMTWWSEDDWAGKVQQVMASGEGDRFEVVRYPAINDEGDEYLLPDDRIIQIPPLSPVPEGAQMTRPRGTAIHPARYTTEAMLRIKANLIASGQKRVWQALYQQNPTPDDGIYFSKDMVRYYVHAPQRHQMFVYQAWDFAITTEAQNDYTVCCTIGQDEHDNLHVLHVLRFRSDDGNAIVEHMIDQSVNWGADLLGFEDGQIWKTLKAQYEKRCLERQHYTTYEVLQPLTDKMVRANPLKGRMQLGKVLVQKNAAWTEAFIRELMTFPAGKHDDQVDAAAWCVRLTLTKSAPRPKAPPKVKSWRDKLGMHMEGVAETSHMSA